MAPPERPGVRPDRAVPATETDTQRPLSRLPPPSALLSNSFKQHPSASLPFFSDASLIKSPTTTTSLTPPEKVGVNTQTGAYQITLQRVFKVPQEITCGRLPGPSQSRVCRSVRTVLHLVRSAALLKPASFSREALNTDAKEQQNKSSRCHVQDKTLLHVHVIKRWPVWEKWNGGFVWDTVFNHNNKPSTIRSAIEPFFLRWGKSKGYRSSCPLDLSVKHMKEQAWVMPTAGWYLHISHVQCPLSQVLFEESYINRLLWQRPSSGRP